LNRTVVKLLSLAVIELSSKPSSAEVRLMIKEITVRNYRPDDLTDIFGIMSEYPSPTGKVWSADVVEEMISDALKEQPDGIFVAETGRRVVGFAIVMHRIWFNVSYLDYIQVKMKWTGKGVGHKLLEKCVDWSRQKGARIIYTETGSDNERAIEFYQKHGFKITGRIPDYYQKGLDAVILVNRLS